MSKVLKINSIILVSALILSGCSENNTDMPEEKNIVTNNVDLSMKDWFVSGLYTESCCCDYPCPCNFGGSSTKGYCNVNGLLEIEKGHYNGVDLSGVTFMYTESMGEWLKYYAEENASDDQLNAIQKILPLVFEYDFEPKVLSCQRVPIIIERTDTSTIYSAPDSYTKVVMLKGLNGDPIKIDNLPFHYTYDYVQYKTIKSEHKSETENFNHSGTHAFVGRVNAAGVNSLKQD